MQSFDFPAIHLCGIVGWGIISGCVYEVWIVGSNMVGVDFAHDCWELH